MKKESIVNIYGDAKKSVTKTLSFRLEPTELTKEIIESEDFISKGEYLLEVKPKVQSILDELHKKFINQVISSFKGAELDWGKLADTLDTKEFYGKGKLADLYSNKLLSIIKELPDFKLFTATTPSKLIKIILGSKDFTKEQKDFVSLFESSASTLEKYSIARRTMYLNIDYNSKSCSIIPRIIYDNFPMYKSNFDIIKNLPSDIIKSINFCDNVISHFEINNYGNSLSQKELEAYNNLIGGFKDSDGIVHKGLNNLINEYNNQNNTSYKKLNRLNKQILEDTSSYSFYESNSIISDEDIKESVSSLLSEDIINPIKRLVSLDKDEYLNNYNFKFSDITYLSKLLFDNNSRKLAEVLLNEIGSDKSFKEIKNILEDGSYTTKVLIPSSLVEKALNNQENIGLAKLFNKLTEDILKIQELNEKLSNMETIKDSNDNISILSEYLDFINASGKILKLFNKNDNNEPNVFSDSLNEVSKVYQEINLVYNSVRNYIQKKDYKSTNIKIDFGIDGLLKNMSFSKLDSNKALFIEKDGKVFLAIPNKKGVKTIQEVAKEEKEENSVIIKYSQKIMVDTKNIYKKYFNDKDFDKYNKPAEYFKDYVKQIITDEHDGKDVGNIAKGIYEYIIKCVNQELVIYKGNPLKIEDYKFGGLNRLLKYLNSLGSLTIKDNLYISNETFNKLADNGDMLLFHITNKDEAVGRTKKVDTKFTQIFKALLDSDNKNVNVCSNGEIFFRRGSTKKPFIHEKDSILVRKVGRDGNTLKFYKEIQDYLNGRVSNISADANTELEKNAIFRKCPHDIIKDKRFYIDNWRISFPLSILLEDESANKNLNETINTKIKSGEIKHVIGIDRGSRNLLYVSVINLETKEIIEQRSLDIIKEVSSKEVRNINYNEKLCLRAKERLSNQKNWLEKENISNLKDGYLSQAITEIVKLVVKYNAIIALEDLNLSFRDKNSKFENTVYTKFETKLVERLSYLTFKNLNPMEKGGVLNGYILADKDSKGLQNGIIFKVPAEYTSKIDPVTGFVDLFKSSYGKNPEETLSKFESIKYDNNLDLFEFKFNYKKIGCIDINKTWVVHSIGERTVYNKKLHKTELYDCTFEVKKLLDKYGVDWQNSDNLINDLKNEKYKITLFKELYKIFKKVIQLRNTLDNEDYILSPVLNKNGEYFDSRNYKESMSLPIDADANGAYNIARKGSMYVNMIKNNSKDIKINRKDYIEFCLE